MRKLILKVEMSLDGFIEGQKGEMDWFDTDDDESWKELFRLLSSVDTVLLGRVMYPGYSEYWRTVLSEPKKYPKNHLRYARWAEKTRHIIFSHTMKKADWENTEVNGGDLEKEVGKLKRGRGGALITFGGATFASALVDRGLVDEYQLIVSPVILGGGKALFKDVNQRLRLKLTRTKAFRSGAVLLRYKSARKETPS
jgi:dihydrofolate reductase